LNAIYILSREGEDESFKIIILTFCKGKNPSENIILKEFNVKSLYLFASSSFYTVVALQKWSAGQQSKSKNEIRRKFEAKPQVIFAKTKLLSQITLKANLSTLNQEKTAKNRKEKQVAFKAEKLF